MPPEVASLIFPRDTAGFVRRRCAACKRAFKVRWTREQAAVLLRSWCELLAHVNAEELGGPLPRRYCPYCGHAEAASGFSTGAQRSYLEEHAGRMRGEVRYRTLRRVHETLGQNPYVTFALVRPDQGSAPSLDPEPDDLVPFHLVCCNEQLKLEQGWRGKVLCHYCRALHATG